MDMTQNLDAEQFKAVMMDTGVVAAIHGVLKQLIDECHLRRGESGGLMPRRSDVLVQAYIISAYPVHGPDNPMRRNLVSSARAVTFLFDRIMAMVGDSFAAVPTDIANLFLDTLVDFSVSLELWTVFDSRRLVERVKRALEALYSAMTLVGDQPELLAQFDFQIVRLRVQMCMMDSSSRKFLDKEEMQRMLRVVGSRPRAVKVVVNVQRRVRFSRGLKESELVRRKLAEFKQCVERRPLPVYFELFVLIARSVVN